MSHPNRRRWTLVLTSLALTVAASTAGASSAQANPCAQPDWSHHPEAGGFLEGPTNIRSGPYLDCTVRGTGLHGDTVTYHCWTSGQDGTWTFLTNHATGVMGWSKDSLLENNGSQYHC
jgi:hypothetical protein